MSLDSRCITVRWHLPERSTTGQVGAAEATSVGFGYAVTLPYLRALPAGRALVCLGAPDQLGPRAADVGFAVVTVAGPGRPALGPDDPARARAAARSLAAGWPDEAMLARAGPRPTSPAAVRRWAAELETCALERLAGLAPAPGPARARPAPGGRLGPSISPGHGPVPG